MSKVADCVLFILFHTCFVVALCGWRVSEVPDCLVDHYTIRRIGLWNFVSIQVYNKPLNIGSAPHLSGGYFLLLISIIIAISDSVGRQWLAVIKTQLRIRPGF